MVTKMGTCRVDESAIGADLPYRRFLWSLPFEALQSSSGRYLVEDVAIANDGASAWFFSIMANRITRLQRRALDDCDMVVLSGGTSNAGGTITFKLWSDDGNGGCSNLLGSNTVTV